MRLISLQSDNKPENCHMIDINPVRDFAEIAQDKMIENAQEPF
jgi:hypothetical protein